VPGLAEAVEDEEELEVLDGVAGQDQHPFHRRSIPHARKGRSTTTARSGNRAAAKKPARQEVDSTNGANASGVNATATPSSVCWSPSAAPLRLGPAVSTVAATERPFQHIDSPPPTTSAGTSNQAAA